MKHVLAIFAALISAAFSAIADPTPAQEAAFMERVEKAFASKDASLLLSLYCFDRTEPQLRQQTASQSVPYLLEHDYSGAELVSLPPDLADPYTWKGVSYAPNLRPFKALVVRFKKSSPAIPVKVTMIVGEKGDSLAIALAAPVSNP